jgi:hypothetical protein
MNTELLESIARLSAGEALVLSLYNSLPTLDGDAASNEDIARLAWERQPGDVGCWLWTGGLYPKGYGRVWYMGRRWRAHRLMWANDRGLIPPPFLHVCHACDVPGCVNPEHLFLCTAAMNNEDRDAKGRKRQPSGEAHGRSKLSALEAQEIVKLHGPDMGCVRLARLFGVNPSTVTDILAGKTWRAATAGLL